MLFTLVAAFAALALLITEDAHLVVKRMASSLFLSAVFAGCDNGDVVEAKSLPSFVVEAIQMDAILPRKQRPAALYLFLKRLSAKEEAAENPLPMPKTRMSLDELKARLDRIAAAGRRAAYKGSFAEECDNFVAYLDRQHAELALSNR